MTEQMKKTETIEDVILRHSQRGMQVLRQFLPDDYCKQAAAKLLALPRGEILLTTGFYVAGYAETDGPVGTYVLARALQKLGFAPCIVTDEFCRDFFEPTGIPVEYAAFDAAKPDFIHLLDTHNPQAVISIERCGVNIEGKYANMRGVSIDEFTAPLDELVKLAKERGIATFGVGDGGNEIGMGNLAKEITERLELAPCTVEVENLIIASVSNWGAYGLAAWLSKLHGEDLLADFDECRDFIARTVKVGSVDGVTHEFTCSVDGFGMVIEQEIIDALHEKLRA